MTTADDALAMGEAVVAREAAAPRLFDPKPYAQRAIAALSIAMTPAKSRTEADERALRSWMAETTLAVAADLPAYRRPDPPERPLSFPASDEDLRFAIARARGARHPTADEKTLLMEEGAHRLLRWNVEHEGSARVQALYGALRTIEKMPPGDAVLEAARMEVEAFLSSEWGLLPRKPTPDFWEARSIGDAASRVVVTQEPRGGREGW